VGRVSKRLAVFLPGLYDGGAERTILNLIDGLASRGHSVDLLLARAEGPYLSEIPKHVRTVVLNPSSLEALRTLGSLPALVNYLRRERPDALLASLHANVISLWARRLARTRTRVVINEQNTFSVSTEQSPVAYRSVVPLLTKAFYPWADLVTAVSKGVADDLAVTTGVPKRQIQVIYNPVITPDLKRKAMESLDHLWFRPDQPPVVLAAGRLDPQKDFPTLIRAFKRVRESGPARLVILGEGSERPGLQALIRELELDQHVALPGFVSNPYAYMAHASVFALSSRWEGLPTVLIEAMCCGAQVVSTDCPSGPSEILANGLYGRLVPVGDSAALSAAITAALRDPRRPSPESWRPFELETVVDQYASALFPG
jgi:glycosyltransferase involved in cell wall biosynthesis